jgi:hypothetical protein
LSRKGKAESPDLDDNDPFDRDFPTGMPAVAASGRQARVDPPAPVRIAAELILARTVDSVPDLPTDLRAGAVILIDVAERVLFEEIRSVWPSILLGTHRRVVYLDKATLHERRAEYTGGGSCPGRYSQAEGPRKAGRGPS